MEEKMQHFSILCFIISRKVKNTTEMQKKVSAVYRQGAVTDQMCQKWFVKFYARGFSLDDASWLGIPVEVHRDQKLLVKMKKYVFYFTEKKLNRLLG